MVVKTITVSTAAQLQSALASATGGETILLKTANYGALDLIDGKTKYDVTHSAAAPVTIRSFDPLKPATLTGLDLRGATGYTFENIKFDYTYNAADQIWTNRFSVTNGTDITIRGCTFDGDVAVNRSTADNGYGFGTGFSASNCDNLVFADNTILKFTRGATFGQNNNLTVTGNEIHTIRMDGMNFSASQGVLIENNYLHDFTRSLTSGDHADMIQFWTAGGSRPSTDIVIRGNTLDIGNGGNTQSIFMRNEEVDTGNAGLSMYYRNVLIEQNTIYNDHLHGITVGETEGLTIRNNAVLHANGGTEGPTGRVSLPTINVAGLSTGVTITDNVTGGLAGNISGGAGLPAAWTVANNLIVQDSNASAANHYTDLFLSTTVDGTSNVHGFLALPGGLIEAMDVGPDALRIDGAPAKITPLFHVATLPSDDAVFVFDAASYTFGPLGAITPDLGTFVWDFGDGTTATGGTVAHSYALPGKYTVKVSVVQPDGTSVSVTDSVTKVHPDLMRFDFKTGSFGIMGDTGETLTALSSTALSGAAGAYAINLGAPGVATASVPKEQLEDLFGADNFAIDLRLKADLKAQSFGEVFRIHNTFVASVNKTGQFVFQMNTDDGKSVTLTSTGPNILDGNTHNIAIRFDADQGFLKLSVDNKTTVSAPVTADLPGMGSWNMLFGNPWGAKNFDGPLSRFDLNVDRTDYPVYTGTDTPVPAGMAAGAMQTASFAMVAPDADLLPDTTLAAIAAPDAATLDDHVLDGAAMAALRSGALHGDTRVTSLDGRTVLAFDGTGDQAVLGRLDQFAQSDRLAVAVEFQRDTADGSSGRLVANAGQILLSVDGDGFRLNVATADAGMKLFKLGSLGLNDTDWHEAVVIVDAGADRLQVFVDDHMVLDDQSHDYVMSHPEGTGRGWVAGTGFDGAIAEIRIDDDIAPLTLQHPLANDTTAYV